MVVKGHHFPKVTLVGVIAADSSLNIDDYRATERTFQILTQVARKSRKRKLTRKSYNTNIQSRKLQYTGCTKAKLRRILSNRNSTKKTVEISTILRYNNNWI